MHIYWNGMSLDSSTARNECCLRNLPIPPPLACRLAALAGRAVCLHAMTPCARHAEATSALLVPKKTCWKLENWKLETQRYKYVKQPTIA